MNAVDVMNLIIQKVQLNINELHFIDYNMI